MGALQHVELVEDRPDDVAAADPRSRRLGWWAATAAVTVAVLMVGGQTLADWREHRNETQFDDVAGVLQPLPEQPSVLWRRTPQETELEGATQVGAHVVTATSADGQYTVREISRTTGKPLWTTRGPVDEAADTSGGAQSECLPAGKDDLVVCSVGPIGPYWIPSSDMATQLVVVDASDGTFVGTWVSPLRLWTASDGQVLTASSTTADGAVTWTLTAYDTTGGTAWRSTLSPVTVQPEPETDEGTVNYLTRLQSIDGVVMFVDEGTVRRLRGGAVTDSFTVPAETEVDLAHDGLVLSRPWTPDDDTTVTTLHLAGGDDVQVDGRLQNPTVDDGSADGVQLFGEGSTVTARDVRTGARLWTQQGVAGRLLVLGGVAYAGLSDHSGDLAETSRLVALDLHTGAIRWSQPLSSPGGGLLTDGRALYSSDELTLHTFALDDGAPLPDRDLTNLEGDAQDAWLSSQDGMLMISRSVGDAVGSDVVG